MISTQLTYIKEDLKDPGQTNLCNFNRLKVINEIEKTYLTWLDINRLKVLDRNRKEIYMTWLDFECLRVIDKKKNKNLWNGCF